MFRNSELVAVKQQQILMWLWMRHTWISSKFVFHVSLYEVPQYTYDDHDYENTEHSRDNNKIKNKICYVFDRVPNSLLLFKLQTEPLLSQFQRLRN